MSATIAATITALKDWFKAGTGLTLVRLENEERPMSNPAWGWLRIMSIERKGSDEIKRENVGGPSGDFFAAAEGQRILTVRIVVESFSQRTDVFSFEYLERLRTIGFTPRILDILKSAEVAFLDANDAIINEDYVVDERWISAARLDARFAIAVRYTESPLPAAAESWIEDAAVTSNTLDDAGGTPLPVSLQVDTVIDT